MKTLVYDSSSGRLIPMGDFHHIFVFFNRFSFFTVSGSLPYPIYFRKSSFAYGAGIFVIRPLTNTMKAKLMSTRIQFSLFFYHVVTYSTFYGIFLRPSGYLLFCINNVGSF